MSILTKLFALPPPLIQPDIEVKSVIADIEEVMVDLNATLPLASISIVYSGCFNNVILPWSPVAETRIWTVKLVEAGKSKANADPVVASDVVWIKASPEV